MPNSYPSFARPQGIFLCPSNDDPLPEYKMLGSYGPALNIPSGHRVAAEEQEIISGGVQFFSGQWVPAR